MELSKKRFSLLALPLLAMFQYLHQRAGKIIVYIYKMHFFCYILYHFLLGILEYFVPITLEYKCIIIGHLFNLAWDH